MNTPGEHSYNYTRVLCPMLQVLLIGSIALNTACNDAPKNRPGAGGVMPTQVVDKNNSDADALAKAKLERDAAEKKKFELEEEAKKKATNPSTDTGAPKPILPRVLTVVTSFALAQDDNLGNITCSFDKGETVTIKTEPIVSTVSKLFVIVEVEPSNNCKLPKLSMTKSQWSGW